MSGAAARAVAVRELGVGRFRIELELDVALVVGERAVAPPHARTVHAAEGARVEAVVAPRASARRRFAVVVAADHGARTVDLRGDGWGASVALTASDEPAPPRAPDPRPVPAAVDLRARDFDALRTMLLGVVDEHVGPGLDDHPVAETAAIIEEIAYLGDALSYAQDAVATEAYLATARRRISVTRHAALLDYEVAQGSSARTWLRFETRERTTLPARTQALARAPWEPGRVSAANVLGALAGGAVVFETLEPVVLEPAHGPCVLAEGTELRPGATAATFTGACEALRPGALVLLEAPPDVPLHAGHVVRLLSVDRRGDATTVRWRREDALPPGSALPRERVHARAGNLVLADHGRTIGWAPLPPPVAGRAYWPALPDRPAYSAGAATSDAERSAAEALAAPGRPARPAVELREDQHPRWHPWTARASLLESGPMATDFVVEPEDDDPSRLRFGDGVNGLRPPDGARLQVRMRTGGGAVGNVGPGSIAHVVVADAESPVLSVRNPVAAVGGEEPESLASVRVNAPRAFRTTDRAVTAPEYRAAALAVDGVADATARVVRSGTGPLAIVRVHTGDWAAPPERVVERVRAALERRRPAGVALDVAAAAPQAAQVALDVVPDPRWTLTALAGEVAAELRATVLRPGRFRFGTALHHSELVAAALALPGVVDVTVARMDWVGGGGPRDRRRETLEPAFGRILRIDDDPAHPEHGSITFRLRAAT